MLNKPAPAQSAVNFIDLQAQRSRIATEIDAAIARVLDHGQFILGGEVEAFEADLSAFTGAKHAVTCASGTDALLLVLMANGIGPGDAVICPAFTFIAPPEVIALRGATPVLADVREENFNIDPASIERAIARAKRDGLRPKAVIAVDLYGHPADYEEISSICDRENLLLIGDAAQSFGSSYRGRRTGTLAHATGTSFFPAKPLGCYGDGGAIFTDDDDLPKVLKSLRMHGQGDDRYNHPRVGTNSRLDALQAAILVEKLKIFPSEIEARDRVAKRYSESLADVVGVPAVAGGSTSVWAQYTIRIGDRDRASFCGTLREAGIPTAIHYPRAVHTQPAYSDYPLADGGAPVAERLAAEVVSLPMHAYLDEATQDRVIEAVHSAAR